MKGKVAFVLGAAVGYVLGSRAGRARYEQIKTGALAVWNSPAVQKGVGAVRGVVDERIDDLKSVAVQAGKDAFANLTGNGTRPPQEPKSDSSASTDASAPSGSSASNSDEAATSSGSQSAGGSRASGQSQAGKTQANKSQPAKSQTDRSTRSAKSTKSAQSRKSAEKTEGGAAS